MAGRLQVLQGQEVDGHAILPESMAQDDRAIIAAVLHGDVERYAELVDRYQAPAIRLAFSLLGNHADAEDASQEAFVSAYRSLAQFRSQAKFSTWLFRIIVNKCKDRYRQRGRQPITMALGEPDPEQDGYLFVDVEDSAAGPRERADSHEVVAQLSLAITALPLQQRTAFALHYLHGLTLGEVADVMGCREGTIKSHIFRATAHLRRALSPWLDAHIMEDRT